MGAMSLPRMAVALSLAYTLKILHSLDKNLPPLILFAVSGAQTWITLVYVNIRLVIDQLGLVWRHQIFTAPGLA